MKSMSSPVNAVRMTLLTALLAFVCCAVAAPETPDSVKTQQAREKWVKEKGYKVYYTKTFDLSDLPEYVPAQKVSGTIRMWGSNYFTDSPLAQYWADEFSKFHPKVRFDFHLKTSEHAISALIFGVSDIGPLGRQIMWDEQLAFQRQFGYLPLGIVAVTGSYDVSGWNPPIGVYLNKQNPLTHLSLQQLDGIFGAERSGAWRGLDWDTSLARGPEKNLRTWGQLGLKGDWADKPIHVYGYNLQFHFPQEIESRAFGGVSTKWNEKLKEYDNLRLPDGKLKLAGQLMLQDLAKDPYGIAYAAGGNAWLTPQIKAVALAERDGGPYVELSLDTIHDRSYPMYADVFFYINRDPDKPIDPKVKEFLRYVLSRQGQAQVMRDGKYLPLTAAVVTEQRKKLD